MLIKEKSTNRIYSCTVEAVDLNFDNKYTMRYCIGIENFQGFHVIRCVYSNSEFNNEFEVTEL